MGWFKTLVGKQHVEIMIRLSGEQVNSINRRIPDFIAACKNTHFVRKIGKDNYSSILIYEMFSPDINALEKSASHLSDKKLHSLKGEGSAMAILSRLFGKIYSELACDKYWHSKEMQEFRSQLWHLSNDVYSAIRLVLEEEKCFVSELAVNVENLQKSIRSVKRS